MPTPILSPYVARGRSSYRNRGSGDYLRLTTGLPASGSWTACAWMYVRPRSATYHYFLGLSGSLSSASNESVLGRSSSNVSEMYSNAATAQFSTDWFGTSGARLFVVCGASGTGANQMFARVRQVTSLAFNESITGQIASYTPAAFWIGNDSYDEWTDHSFWNVRLWGRALSAAEALRESFSAQPVARDGLIGWWPLEGDLDQLLRDYSGNGRHLTRAGTPRVEPFFLPANVLMPLVDDAAVDAAAGGDVSRSLTGQSVTVSAGSLTSAVSQALSGQAVTASAGTVVPAVAQALSGQAVTASAGTAVAAIDYALSGQQITTAQGTVGTQSGGDVSVNLTGQAVTVSAGSLTAAVSQALSGQQVSASAGSVIAEVAPALSGLGIVVSQGSVGTEVGGDVSRALTGQSITVEQGTLGTEGGDSAQTGSGGSNRRRKKRQTRIVEIDGKRFVGTDEQIEAFIARAERAKAAPAEPKPRASELSAVREAVAAVVKQRDQEGEREERILEAQRALLDAGLSWLPVYQDIIEQELARIESENEERRIREDDEEVIALFAGLL